MEQAWIIIAVIGAFLGGIGGVYTGSWYLRRAVRELQYGIADLEDRLVREVKKRASMVRWEADSAPVHDLTQEFEQVAKGLTPTAFMRKKWGHLHGTLAKKDREGAS